MRMPAVNDNDLTMDITSLMPEATLPDVECRPQSKTAARMDEEVFRAFYERTARQVWAYLSRISDPQMADDLLQEAYYRLYRAGDAYEGESHRRNALFRIATNLVHDSRRRRRGRTAVSLSHGDELELQQVAGDNAERVAGRIDLRRALTRLRPQQREILWLAYAQGLSHDEIAGVTGASRKSIKSLLYRARQKLAALLRGGGGSRE
jgi:RNA polymerase sigma-70 factor, ECF subfamily